MMRADPFFQERGVSFHYPVSHLVSPTVFVTKKMMLGSVLHIEGITHDTEENAVLNQFKKNWHQALLGLGEDFSVMVTLHRRKQSVTLDGSFESKFLEELDQEYRVSLENEPLYVNDIYLTVLTKGIVFSPSVNPLKKLIGLNSGSFKKSSEVLY
ncbi:MAG: hypothetical protein KDH94_05385, partial [Coxiellaceae bacterium]|nr:hypothetical protein [Coxiellaceae bacterium]